MNKTEKLENAGKALWDWEKKRRKERAEKKEIRGQACGERNKQRKRTAK